MRIAMVPPLYESVPPRLYGGTERIVHYLTDELVRMGHEVTLFGSGDSKTLARLNEVCPLALRLDPNCRDEISPHILQLEIVAKEADAGKFDIIHFHTGTLHLPIARRLNTPSITTLHGRLDCPELLPLFSAFRDLPFISISNSQRTPLPFVKWQTTIYHGLPTDHLHYSDSDSGYLAFLGRISPEKRPDRAIEIARRAGKKIKIAAKIDKADRDYFSSIAHFFDQSHVEFIGEISENEKGPFLGQAEALLFPIDWPEPFGLAVIEALATGTPVIAFNHGSVPELIRHGVTGYIVDNVDDAVRAVNNLDKIERLRCRAEFDERFRVDRMARDYVEAFRAVINQAELDEERSSNRVRRTEPVSDIGSFGSTRGRNADSQARRDVRSVRSFRGPTPSQQ